MKKLSILIWFSILVACTEDASDAPPLFKVDEVSLRTNTQEGTDDHNIRDLWMFLDGVDLGVFTLPTEIPVIPVDGQTNGVVQFSPGVRNNGINSSPIIYPFYQSVFREEALENGTCQIVDLEFQYDPTTQFAYIQDFELENGLAMDQDGDGEIGITLSTEQVFEGARSAHIALNDETPFTEVASLQTFENLPLNGSPVFMEINYKNDVELNIGLIGFFGNQPITNISHVLNPSEEWNKVYIDFTFILLDSQLDAYKLFFGAAIDQSGQNADVFIDNIKLVHF